MEKCRKVFVDHKIRTLEAALQEINQLLEKPLSQRTKGITLRLLKFETRNFYDVYENLIEIKPQIDIEIVAKKI